MGSGDEVSCLGYVGYYFLLFFAYWFGANRFDRNGDGEFDPADVDLYLMDMGILGRNFRKTKRVKRRDSQTGRFVQEQQSRWRRDVGITDWVESDVQGEAVEDVIEKRQTPPIFMIAQSILALALWIGGSIKTASSDGTSFWGNKGGIDSFSPGRSDLRLFGPECQDYRGEFWRYLTYQWTHVGLSHVLMNCFMNIMLGVPLEGLHGPLRTLFMYNVGVFGGACLYWVGDAHTTVVGMSGGCYALLGMHIADLLMNWRQKRFRIPTMVLIAVLIAADLLTYFFALGSEDTTHTVHVGGAIMGLFIGVLVGVNLVVLRCERILQVFAFFIMVGIVAFCIVWLSTHSAAQNITEDMGWCWLRQVYNISRFGNQWTCVTCASKACIGTFAQEQFIETVDLDACVATHSFE